MTGTHRARNGRGLPLRVRLILWSSGLVLILCAGLVLFVNILVSKNFPRIIYAGTTQLAGGHQRLANPPPTGSMVVLAPNPLVQQQVDINRRGLSNNLLASVRITSLIGLGTVSILGCAGAYWLVGRALRPLQQLSRATERVGASTLHTRLAFAGPDDEIKGLADAFDAMLARLEQAFAMQGRFVGDVSHELRTPLALLRTNLEVAKENKDASIPALIATQERAVDRLERLVKDLLLLAQSEQPRVLQNSVSLGPLIEEVLDEMRPAAVERGVTLRLDASREIVVATTDDGMLLARAVRNLIENAITYSHPGGPVGVTVGCEASWALVTVADSGIGMTPEQQSHAFERFYRAEHARTRHTGGAGLGLSIVSAIARLHGGRVDIASTPHVGSVFTLRLPL